MKINKVLECLKLRRRISYLYVVMLTNLHNKVCGLCCDIICIFLYA